MQAAAHPFPPSAGARPQRPQPAQPELPDPEVRPLQSPGGAFLVGGGGGCGGASRAGRILRVGQVAGALVNRPPKAVPLRGTEKWGGLCIGEEGGATVLGPRLEREREKRLPWHMLREVGQANAAAMAPRSPQQFAPARQRLCVHGSLTACCPRT